MNNLDKAKKLVDCISKNRPIYICSANTVNVANTYTVNSNEKAKVKNIGTNQNALLEFYIPKGLDGNSEKIKVGSTQTLEPGEDANVEDDYKDGIHTLNFYIPKGDANNFLINTAYITTFEDNYHEEGLEIKENGRVPLTRIELDTSDTCTLNNNTIKFNKDGYYKVAFVVRSYVKTTNPFDASKDFVSLGFRENNTDNVYIGGSDFITDSTSKEIYAHGILSIADPNKLYELVNLSKRSIYLKTPDLKNINSNSYFVNSPVSMIIEYLGKGKS